MMRWPTILLVALGCRPTRSAAPAAPPPCRPVACSTSGASLDVCFYTADGLPTRGVADLAASRSSPPAREHGTVAQFCGLAPGEYVLTTDVSGQRIERTVSVGLDQHLVTRVHWDRCEGYVMGGDGICRCIEAPNPPAPVLE